MNAAPAAGAPLDLLKSHFGYAQFRPLPAEIIGPYPGRRREGRFYAPML